jgi:hypothetical protein
MYPSGGEAMYSLCGVYVPKKYSLRFVLQIVSDSFMQIKKPMN